MNAPGERSWVPAVLLAGAAYCIIGRAFAAPTSHGQAWRYAAWAVSGIVYAAHIWYEHGVRRNVSVRSAALHVAAGVAVGALGLAIVGMIHSLSIAPVIRPAWLLALIVWPAATAIPACCGALVAAVLLARLSRRA